MAITAIAAAVLASCLLLRAFRRQGTPTTPGRHSLLVSPYAGRHCRRPEQPPSPVLQQALETVGTHGLGFLREGEATH
ncbi:hypothetical protein [Actinokineospora sp. NPDC004072]